jgi:CheY-like chemotaxis protein
MSPVEWAGRPRRGPGSTSSGLRASAAGKQLLIVEDDAPLRENLIEVFVLQGFEVAAAEDGEGALELFGRGAPPDVMLLDYALPDLNGGEIYERMKAAARVPPTILLTADVRAAELAAHHGMPFSVRKPFDTAALITLVVAVVTRSPVS